MPLYRVTRTITETHTFDVDRDNASSARSAVGNGPISEVRHKEGISYGGREKDEETVQVVQEIDPAARDEAEEKLCQWVKEAYDRGSLPGDIENQVQRALEEAMS